MYKPKEIIVAKDVKNHPVTCSILDKCPGVPVRVVDSNQPDVIRKASHILSNSDSLAETICVGKNVLASCWA